MQFCFVVIGQCVVDYTGKHNSKNYFLYKGIVAFVLSINFRYCLWTKWVGNETEIYANTRVLFTTFWFIVILITPVLCNGESFVNLKKNQGNILYNYSEGTESWLCISGNIVNKNNKVRGHRRDLVR